MVDASSVKTSDAIDTPSAVDGNCPQALVTRFEVIFEGVGRVVVYRDVDVTLSYQDDGRTLKVFVKHGARSAGRAP